MTMHFCRNLISLCLRNSNASSVYKPRISIFPSFFFFFSSTSEPLPQNLSEYLIQHHKFSPDTISKLSSPVNYLKNPEKSALVLSFFEEFGFSSNHLEKTVKSCPSILAANIDSTIKPKIKLLQELGLSSIDIAQVVSANSNILMRSYINQLSPSILTLKSVLGSDEEVRRVIRASGFFLKYDLEKSLVPNIEFLKGCGVSSLQISHFMYLDPRFFVKKPETIKEIVRWLDDIGFNRNSKKFLYAIRTLSMITRENWELKGELLRSFGFSEDDILSMFRKTPDIFTRSVGAMKDVIQVLLASGKCDISFIARYPRLFSFSVENRIKPRLRVVEVLENKNLLHKKLRLTTVCSISHKVFLERFVLPYRDDVGEMYQPNEVSSEKNTELLIDRANVIHKKFLPGL